MLPDLQKHLFNIITTLKCVTLWFGNTPDIVRDTSPTNDHQRDLDGHGDPYAFHEGLLSLNRKHRFLFPLLYDTCNVRDLIVGIWIPSSISFPTLLLNSFP